MIGSRLLGPYTTGYGPLNLLRLLGTRITYQWFGGHVMAEAEIELRIPADLGLSAEQVQQLADKFQNELVQVVRGTQAQESAEETPSLSPKAKSQIV
jgi:hypothetical protein